MSASILQSQQAFSLPSDPGVHWNANAASSTPGANANERGPNTPPRSYDAATGGRSDVDYGAVYGT